MQTPSLVVHYIGSWVLGNLKMGILVDKSGFGQDNKLLLFVVL